ncbi:MAG: ABC transporter permease subunit [Propionibacteriales bacterium]|nr:ABC transporter permease subunit [Propionibacteriales bacterium]
MGSTSRARRDGRWVPWLFVGPMLLVFAAFYLWPAVQTVASSFFEWSLLTPWEPADPETWEFVGLDNYRTTLTSGDFWNATVNTLIWLVALPLLVGVFSLALALLVWFAGRGSSVLRSVFVLPLTISLAAVGVIWTFVYNPDPDVGVLNAVLRTLRLDELSFDVGWLELNLGAWLSNLGHLDLGPIQVDFTNIALVLPAFWAFTGFGVITFTAGLTAMPDDLLEAAKIDGAGPLQTVRNVIIPSLRGPMIVVLVQMVIFALRTFDIVYVMTGGGPADDTMVLALLLWLQAFSFLDTPQAGQAAAIAVLLSATLIVGAYPYIRRATRSDR